MSKMTDELSEAPQVIENAIAACLPVAKQISEECSKRNIRRIAVAGRGSSLNAGIAFKFFTEISTPYLVSFEYPSVITLFSAKRNLNDTLYIVISQSGAGPDTLAFAEAAKTQGALTVACTNFTDSPLAKLADFTLDISAGEEKAVAATKTLTGEIAALLVLADALAGKTTDKELAVNAVKAALASPAPAIPAALLDTEKVICLSRGVTEVVAKECGLKLMEACYLFTFAASTNEFKHGPKALLTAGVPVVLFAPDGKCKNDYLATAKDVKSAGAYLIAFTDIEEVAQAADLTVAMPAARESEQPLVYLVKMQQFVAALSQALGLNPDAPRNLNKVTITN